MSILFCRDCGVDVSGESLFRQVTFGIESGEKVGLVGPNGAGKTTLLRACLGEHRLEAGQVYLTGTVGYLPQNPLIDEQGTVWERMLAERSDLLDMRDQLRRLEEKMGDNAGEKVFDQYSALTERYERSGGYALEALIRKILSGLGIGAEVATPIEKLSGGQKTRLALSKLLLNSPDLLILDEPTNHLDVDAMEWLESYLRSYPGAIFVVSHDRYFLDHVVQKVLHLENGFLKAYTGNYSEYELQRAVEEITLAREAERVQKKISRLEDYIRRNRAGVHAKQARGRETQLNKIKAVEVNNTKREYHFSLATGQRSGDRTLMINNLGIAFPERRLFSDVSVELRRGDRVALLGKNGVGKTSFLKAICGKLPFQGEIRLGANVTLGYYSQEHEELEGSGSCMDEVRRVSNLKESEIRSMLARFGFVGEEVFKTVRVLSGGEKSRLALALLFLRRGNLLLLDEPTNHLDSRMRQALEETLQDFDGTLVVVSHDRYFLDQVINKILLLTPQGVEVFAGDYSDYKSQTQADNIWEEKTAEAKTTGKGGRDRDALRKEKRAQHLEREIQNLEQALEAIKNKLDEAAADFERAAQFHSEYVKQQEQLDLAMEEWLSLTEELQG